MSETDADPVDWQGVVGALPGAVAVDGTFVHVSTAFAQTVGVSDERLAGEVGDGSSHLRRATTTVRSLRA